MNLIERTHNRVIHQSNPYIKVDMYICEPNYKIRNKNCCYDLVLKIHQDILYRVNDFAYPIRRLFNT